MIGTLKQNYNARTPMRWRALGDSILLAGPMLSGAVVAAPLSENTQKWIILAINLFCVFAKMLTNFMKETEEDKAAYRNVNVNTGMNGSTTSGT